MSIQKSEIKIGTANQIGSKLDDMLEQSQAEMRRCEGAKSSLKQVASMIQDLTNHVNKDVEEGKLDFGEDTLKVAETVNKWILRCAAVAENLSIKAEVAFLVQQGKADGLQASVVVAAQVRDQEQQKIVAIQSGGVDGRPVGTHPDGVAAVQDLQARRAEAAAEKAAEKAAESSDGVVAEEAPPEVTEAASDSDGEDEPKRRGRPKGSKNLNGANA